MKNRFIFKFNDGYGAILCCKCNKIIKVGRDFDEIEKKFIKSNKNDGQYYFLKKEINKRLSENYYLCDECKKNIIDNNK